MRFSRVNHRKLPLSKREPKKSRKGNKGKLTSLRSKGDGFKRETITEKVRRRMAELSKEKKLGFFVKVLQRRMLLKELREEKMQEWREAHNVKPLT